MNSTEDIRILIAEDHPVFRKGLFDTIVGESRLIVVGQTGDGRDVLRLVHELRPTVLLLDISMPGMNGLEIAALIRDQCIPVRIIVLTMHKEEGIFNKAMDLGVWGYVLKDSAVKDILESIRSVVRDEYYISPAISGYLMNRRDKAAAVLEDHPGLDELTSNERNILKLVSENRSSKDIAGMLFISVRTVENHRMNISKKLNLHGSNALLKFALENKSHL